MCFHVSVPGKEVLEKRFPTVTVGDLWDQPLHHRSGFAFAPQPVISMDKPEHFQLFSWGLIPSWFKKQGDLDQIRMMTLNARAETIFEKASFKTAVTRRRCIIPVDGFFEWMHVGSKRFPHFIFPAEGLVFSLGGLCDTWVNQITGELHQTFSIITTEANPMMEKIHNSKKRMPLILDPEKEFQWLSPVLSKENIQEFLRPFPEQGMKAHSISKRITSRTESPNVPEVKEPFVYAELSL